MVKKLFISSITWFSGSKTASAINPERELQSLMQRVSVSQINLFFKSDRFITKMWLLDQVLRVALKSVRPAALH